MTIPLSHYLAVSAALFSIGLFGALTRRSAIIVLIGIEIMMNAANLNLIAFWRYSDGTRATGQLFTFFGITIAAAEVAVGLAIVISVYRLFQSTNVNEISDMKK
ncbi:MAG: NADH-quinone oxidoreductase subunit NuoK [Candidatus Omnitrophica bacterium]|nr:NADH-quinone oxidoreductase subunit NuoK [Candidatus Omnitrophota bacterium]